MNGAFSLLVVLSLSNCCFVSSETTNLDRRRSPPPSDDGLCARMIRPLGYPCSEHTVETEDGFILTVQHIPYGRNTPKAQSGPPVFFQHGLFQGGDAWFMNSVEESLGFVLADQGFDVWVGNVRGTRWSRGHITFSVHDREFWDWSWQELAQIDMVDMISYVYLQTNSKILFVGHSQGTIMGLAAFTMPDTVKMIEAAALLTPISYLDHITSRFALRALKLHLDQMLSTLGIHQINFRSDIGFEIINYVCDGHIDCSSFLAVITGTNCCFNQSRVQYYMEYEPQPTSTKNLNHLFQMIRKGTFAKYDYGLFGNLKRYGSPHPTSFDLQDIPETLPLWMAYGGRDDLADVTDVKRTIKELRSEPKLLYVDHYGHLDFIMGVTAYDNVYDSLISFFRSCGETSSY